MDKGEAVKIFDLVVQGKTLPATMDKLVPMSFIGSAAVKFYQAKVKLMDQLGVSEEQRKATLADGQDAGVMLLNIEARIGELIESVPEREKKAAAGRGERSLPVEVNKDRSKAAQAIHRNPAAVAEVIREAKENEDIPTKTAVLNKIKHQKAEAQLKAFREQYPKGPKPPELPIYLEKCIDHLVQVNTVVKQFFNYPDQVQPDRMQEFIRQVKILVGIISEKTKEIKWKQLN
jgi:hypothetical protein